jgi:hypothetical protein
VGVSVSVSIRSKHRSHRLLTTQVWQSVNSKHNRSVQINLMNKIHTEISHKNELTLQRLCC